MAEALALDFEREKDFAEVLLASADMMFVLSQLAKLPPGDETTPDVIYASVAIVTAYCRPFASNNRHNIPGKRWIGKYTADEMTLHKRALSIRGTDLAHSAVTPGRVQVFVDEIPAAGNIHYHHQWTQQGFMREDLSALATMVSKVRQAIEVDKDAIGQAVLRARIAAGHKLRFTLGEK
jgi:hypothetical protein